jgi:hypothetical protein
MKPTLFAVILLVSSITTLAQSPPYLFGPPDLSAPRHVSPLGNRYYAWGYDLLGSKRVNRKLRNQLTARGVQPSVIESSIAYARSFVQNPGHIGRLIDAAYIERREAFFRCGQGTWQHQAALNSPPGSFTIKLEPTIIYLNGVWTIDVGTANELRATVFYITGLVSDPRTATEINRLENTLTWGIGNVIAHRGGYNPGRVENEIGHRDPCGFQR